MKKRQQHHIFCFLKIFEVQRLTLTGHGFFPRRSLLPSSPRHEGIGGVPALPGVQLQGPKKSPSLTLFLLVQSDICPLDRSLGIRKQQQKHVRNAQSLRLHSVRSLSQLLYCVPFADVVYLNSLGARTVALMTRRECVTKILICHFARCVAALVYCAA